jgi:hypothetical protein
MGFERRIAVGTITKTSRVIPRSSPHSKQVGNFKKLTEEEKAFKGTPREGTVEAMTETLSKIFPK